MSDEQRTAYICFTETKEYRLELDFADMAKILGVSKKKLAAIVDDGEDYEPSDAAMSRLLHHAETESEEFTVDEIEEA
jgi:DNA-binding XRE family transcriptional regulator